MAWLLPALASAQSKDGWHFRPCLAGSVEHHDAHARLAGLDAAIAALVSKDDVDGIRAALEDLRSSECFDFTWLIDRAPEVHNAITIRQWWGAGGAAYLRSLLDITSGPHRAGQPISRPLIFFPPDERSSLTLDTEPQHELAALLCREEDLSCGVETTGWRLRAEQRLRALAEERRAFRGEARTQTRAGCAADVAAMPKLERLADWVACIDDARETSAALPLGRFRAPTRGWIVLRGGRDYEDFCDEIRAYDLATGAAYVSQNCGRLVRSKDGSVDRDATDRTRRLAFMAGRLPIEALREAALMTMLSEWVEEDVSVNATVERLPANIPLEWTEDFNMGGVTMYGSSSCGWSTGYSWEWLDQGRVIAEGGLRWPSVHPGRTYAGELWEIAEAGLIAGCAPAALSTLAPLTSGPSNGPGPDEADARFLARAASLVCAPVPARRRRTSH